MRIQHNIMAMNAYRNYNTNTSALSKNLEKLSSGYKINRAGDDAAGLAISEKMRAQITGLNAAQKNVKDGVSLVKTAEGAMQEIQDMLNRMDYLATQSANGTYDNEVDRANLQKEVNALKTEINRIADSANFNGINLLDGSMDEGKVTSKLADSAISEITTTDYAPKGASDTFEATFIRERTPAPTQQVNASFDVSLDQVKIAAASTSTGVVTISLKVGDKTVSITMATSTAAITGEAVASALKNAMMATTQSATTGVNTAGATVTGLEIDGNIYTVTESAGKLSFTLASALTENVTPDYAVELDITAQDAAGDDLSVIGPNTGDNAGKYNINDHVQNTVTGLAAGATLQAQVDVKIDFTKLKDGDRLTVGDTTYVFKIGKDSTTTTDAGSGDGTALGKQTLIDLSVKADDIFREESDLLDADKQAKAMVKITNAIAGSGNTTWSAGNFGITGDNQGTLSFQSLSNYTDENKTIGGKTGAVKADMKTEASVMKQFFATKAEVGASASFKIDPTKIKVGDTFTIDGKTFEFTDGVDASSKANVAIDLSALGVSGGLVSSQIGDVLDAVKTAITGNLEFKKDSPKYTVTTDVNEGTIKLTSNENNDTSQVLEARSTATITTPTITSTGKALTLQIGDTSASYNQLSLSIGDMHTDAMGTDKGAKIADIDISNQASAQAAVQTIKDAINYVSGVRGDLGAVQNRLEHTQNNLSVMAENIQDAESTIRDTDVAEEMMSYVKNNILVQSAQAMLAQANQVPQGVLQLLG